MMSCPATAVVRRSSSWLLVAACLCALATGGCAIPAVINPTPYPWMGRTTPKMAPSTAVAAVATDSKRQTVAVRAQSPSDQEPRRDKKNPEIMLTSGELPLEADTGYPGDSFTRPGPLPGYAFPGNQVPLPLQSYGPWRPPGIACPWPIDEYLFDGGDHDPATMTRADRSLYGLNVEDTVAQYEGECGDRCIKPSNRVCIYAPRFAAVRKIDTVYQNDQFDQLSGVDAPLPPARQKEVLGPTTKMQPVELVDEVGLRRPIGLIERQPLRIVEVELIPKILQDALLPYEDFAAIRAGIVEESERAMLSQNVQNALVWTNDQAPEVLIGGVRAAEIKGHKEVQLVYQCGKDPPCLTLCKVASTQSAKVGETVDFTLRFDNVGQQRLHNVVISDNLTSRLELVPDSAKSSVKSRFSTKPNEVNSLSLKWEILEPINVGHGGVIRFQCKVR